MVGFVWVVIREVEGYDGTIAEINDIAVSVSQSPNHEDSGVVAKGAIQDLGGIPI